MAYEDPNAPSTVDKSTVIVDEKKIGRWDWLWTSIMAVIIFRLFGAVGGLVTFGCYCWLRPKIGTWGAIAVSGVTGIVVAIGLSAMI